VLTFRALLEPARAERLRQQHSLDPSQPGLEELLDALVALCEAPTADDHAGELTRTVQSVALTQLLTLALDARISPAVRATVEASLVRIRDLPSTSAHAAAARRLVEQYFRDPRSLVLPRLAEPPPGAPI